MLREIVYPLVVHAREEEPQDDDVDVLPGGGDAVVEIGAQLLAQRRGGHRRRVPGDRDDNVSHAIKVSLFQIYYIFLEL